MNSPKKLLLLDDEEHLICGGMDGFIDIINILLYKVAHTFKISSGERIFDIAKL